MRRLAGIFTSTLLAVAVAAAGPAAAQTAPKCGGINLLERLGRSDPDALREIETQAAKVTNANAVFWKIEREGIAPSHLFGTVHVTDQRVADFPAGVRRAITAADVMALEVADLAAENVGGAMARLGSRLYFTDGKQLSDYLTSQESAQATELLAQAGMVGDVAQVIKPWFVSILMAVPQCEQLRGMAGLKTLDAQLEALAKQAGARTVGLETAAEQLEAMSGLPLDAQVAWLQANLKMVDQLEDSHETLIQLYLERRLGTIWPLTRHFAKGVPNLELALSGFQKALLDIRNQTMATRSLPLLKAGNAVVAVGALHLSGPTGLVALYREAGYTVTALD